MRLARREVLAFAATAFRSSASEAAELQLAVVVHASNSASVTVSDLEAMFRVQRQHWSNGGRVVAFNLPPSSLERKLFDRVVLNLSPDQVSRYWIERRIRGGDLPPRTAPTAAFAVRLVASLPEAIGYVPRGEIGSGVRPVAWIQESGIALVPR